MIFFTTLSDHASFWSAMPMVVFIPFQLVMSACHAKMRSASEDQVDIDFMFVDEQTFAKVKQESTEEDYDGSIILVPTPMHLTALKLHAIRQQPKIRELKDLNGIVELVRINHIDVRSDPFKSTCAIYGTKELYEKIVLFSTAKE